MDRNPGPELVDSAAQVLDALRGPSPRASVRPRGGPHGFPTGTLVAGGVLWGLSLALLAPASTLVMGLSGLTPEGESLLEAVDVGFFAGFLPLMAVVVTVLLSLNHWPLQDLDQYHRELFAGMALVGILLLVELHGLGSAVISDDIQDSELFVYGSLVIQGLLVYLILRTGARGLASAHTYGSAWPPRDAAAASPADVAATHGELPANTARYGATTALWLHGLLWGVIISTAAGAAAGTLLFPLLGTLVGAYFGAIYGLIPTLMGAAFVVTVVSWRRDTDPVAVYQAVEAALVAVCIAVLVGLWPFLQTATFTPSPWEDANIVRTWLTVVPVVILLLRLCAPKLASAYISRVDPR